MLMLWAILIATLMAMEICNEAVSAFCPFAYLAMRFQNPLNDVPPPLFRGKVWGGTLLEPCCSTWCGMAIISLGSSHASRVFSLEMSLPRGDSYLKDGTE